MDTKTNVLNFCKAQGFTSKGETFMILEQDTYSIKDELKAKGCKYNKLLGWHSPVDLPEYKTEQILLSKVYHMEKATGNIVQKESAEDFIQKVREKAFPPKVSNEFEGSEIKDLEVTFVEHTSFVGKFGFTNVYTFMDEDLHYFVWFTKSAIDVELNDVIYMTADIKEKKEYKGVKQTVVKNVKYTALEGML